MKNDKKMYWIAGGIILLALLFFKGGGTLFAVGDLPNAVPVDIRIEGMVMSDGCNGEFKIAPLQPSWPALICLGSSCYDLPEGVYGVGSTFTLSTTDSNPEVSIQWSRIKDPQGRFDHKQSAISTVKNKCGLKPTGAVAAYSDSRLTQMVESRSPATTNLGIYVDSCDSTPKYQAWIAEADTCRITEDLYGTPISGGSQAAISYPLGTNHVAYQIGSTCLPSVYIDTQSWFFALCVAGSPPTNCPTNLCNKISGIARNNVVIDSSGTTTVVLTGDASIGVTLSWNPSLLETPLGPVCGNSQCESGETSASCPADCPVTPICTVLGDTNCDGVVSMSELMNYIQGWKAGINTMGNLMVVINNWKSVMT